MNEVLHLLMDTIDTPIGQMVIVADSEGNLRAIRESDAFPATDIGLLRGATLLEGTQSTSTSLLNRAESWRPWRAYAVQHLWAAGDHAVNVMPA